MEYKGPEIYWEMPIKDKRGEGAVLFNIVLRDLANAIRQEKKRYTEWKGRNKTVFVFR